MNKYARLNFKFLTQPEASTVAMLTELLHESAVAAQDTYVGDFEVFYNAKEHIIGVSVPYVDGHEAGAVRAGLVLGWCLCELERSHERTGDGGSTWMSTHNAADEMLSSFV